MNHSAVHHDLQTIKRSRAQSATARIAYVARCEVTDPRTGERSDFSHRTGDLERAPVVIGFDGTPAQLAAAMESRETRRDAQTGRSSIIALPHEIDGAAQARIATRYGEALNERHGVAVVVVIHRPGNEGDHRNWHVHAVETRRRVGPNGELGEDVSELTDKRKSREEVEWRRQKWATLCNEELDRAGVAERIDPRSLERRALDAGEDRPRVKSRHHGPAVTAAIRAEDAAAASWIAGDRGGRDPAPVRIRDQLDAEQRASAADKRARAAGAALARARTADRNQHGAAVRANQSRRQKRRADRAAAAAAQAADRGIGALGRMIDTADRGRDGPSRE